jgi:hypothetical protein
MRRRDFIKALGGTSVAGCLQPMLSTLTKIR